jgi:hypothetical protein
MSQPSVNNTERDGALGLLPASSGKFLAFAGPADSGPIDTPRTFARPKDLIAVFGGGPTVEAACHALERYGKPVVFTRTTASTAGSYLNAVTGEDGEISSITKTGTGTCVFTDNASDPLVAAQVVVLFDIGGTRGTTGIVYRYSLDNGSTFSPPQALSTAITFNVGSTGASIAVSAGTIVAGDFISFTLTAPIEASAGELVTSALGSSVPTNPAGTFPNDDYEMYLKIITGGTVGISGITFQYSYDNGRTMSQTTALGTAAFFVWPNSGGTRVNFGAGTLTAGGTLAFPTVAPCWNTSDLSSALTALKNTAINWELVNVIGPATAAALGVVDTAIAGMHAVGKYRWAMMHTRMPIGTEDEGTYAASLNGVFGSLSSSYIAITAGGSKLVSSVSGREYTRPPSFQAAAREANVTEEINTADVNLGPLPGTRLTDDDGNPDEHDESVNPGLDDQRFYVLRSWDSEIAGTYVNRPRIFSTAGSDFYIVPHRRVMNLAKAALRVFLIRRMNKPIRVSKTTGFILETEALEIESSANAILRSVLLAKPKASAATFVLSRTDNVLSTKELNADVRIIPLAYAETISNEIGYLNPALQTVSV